MRRRYQKGQLIDDGDRWMGRWRVDVIDARTGKVKRVRKYEMVASKKECPTRRMAQKELDRILGPINGNAPAEDPIWGWLERAGVDLCDSCRGRLIAALRTKEL